jgi:hypothetical protein
MITNSVRGGAGLFHRSQAVRAIALAVQVLAAAGCSKESPSAPAPEQSSTTVYSPSGWKLDLKVAPDHPRMVRRATLAVRITDGLGKPAENAQVTGSLNMALQDMGETGVKFEPKGNGDYEATVPSFDMSGTMGTHRRCSARRGPREQGFPAHRIRLAPQK